MYIFTRMRLLLLTLDTIETEQNNMLSLFKYLQKNSNP